jgi:2'-5' RNA ligase
VSEAIRSFVAVSISDGARRQIADLLNSFRRESGGDVRWVKPELMHLTLVFLGDVPRSFLDSAKTRLSQVAARHKAFEVQLRGLGAFPGSSRARVVWVGTDKGRSEVCALQKDVETALSSVGYQPERRPFSPHLTIGRLRVPGDVSRVAATQFESELFTVDRVVLFRSVLGPGGPTYSRLSEFSLQTSRARLLTTAGGAS